MPLPEVFTPGEFLDVSGQLNRNFDYLYQLFITGGGSKGVADGTATVLAQSKANVQRDVQASGVASTDIRSQPTSLQLRDVTTAGVGIATAIGQNESRRVVTAAGNSQVSGFSPLASTRDVTSAGTSTVAGVLNQKISRDVTAIGVSTVVAGANWKVAQPVATIGTATVTGRAPNAGAVESLDGASNTGPPTVAMPQINASVIPGSATTALNSFSLTGFAGNVMYNGVLETDPDVVVGSGAMLYYSGHIIYLQTTQNSWYRWFAANDWRPAPSPLVDLVAESLEGASVTTVGPAIFGSTVPGTNAPPPASVINGQLTAWRISPASRISYQVGTADPVEQPFTANATRIYYTGHRVYHMNTDLNWFVWGGGNPSVNNWSFAGNGINFPVPTTPTINIAPVLDQYVRTAFVVSGTYQSYPGNPVIPVLQFADNFQQGVQTTTWSGTDKSPLMVLANSNITATSGTGVTTVRSNTSFASGKRIFEVSSTMLSPGFRVGLSSSSYALTSGLGDNNFGFAIQPARATAPQAYYLNGQVLSSLPGQPSPNGDKVTIAVDLTAKLLWFSTGAMRAAGQDWNNDVLANQSPGVGGQAVHGGLSFAAFTGPYFITFNESTAASVANLNTIGPYATGVLPDGYVSWDVGTATTWQNLPSTVSVTATSFSFVHPPIANEQFSPGSNLAVRDGVNTGIIGVSNTFKVQTPGQVSLGALSLTNTQVSANQPIGTKVGDVLLQVNGGTFTGTMAVTTGGSQFNIPATSGNPRELRTAAVLAPNQSGIPIVITATMTSAVPTSVSLNRTIIVNTEAATATSVTTAGPTIIGSNVPNLPGTQNTWRLVTQSPPNDPFVANLNTQNVGSPKNVHELYYINHTLYCSSGPNFENTWAFWNGSAFISCPSPKPIISLNTTSFPPVNGDTGIRATLQSAGLPMSAVTWTEDSPSFAFDPGTNVLKTVGAIPAPAQFNVNITATVA